MVRQEVEGRDVLLGVEEDCRRGDHGKEADVPDTGSGDEDTRIFPAQEEHCGELNGCCLQLVNTLLEYLKSIGKFYNIDQLALLVHICKIWNALL